MCGSSDKASRAAEAREAERQKKIEEAQGRLDQIFGSPARRGEYEKVTDATRNILQSDLDREHKDASLKTKFALARGGLAGGSVDIDKNTDLAEMYLRGIVEAERKAQSAGSSLEAKDAESKAQIMNSVLAGLDSGRAGMQAQSALRTNYSNVANQDYMGTFDNLFGNLGEFWKNSRLMSGDRRAAYDFNSLYGSRGGGARPSPAGSVYGGM